MSGYVPPEYRRSDGDYYDPYDPPDPYEGRGVDLTPKQVDPNAWLYDPNADPSGFPALPGGRQWAWNGRQWTAVAGGAGPAAPTAPTTGGDYTPPGGYGGGGGGDYGGYQLPNRSSLASLNYPTLNLPRAEAPPAFSYGDFSFEGFKAPTLEDAQNEPGFDYALKQGVKAFENSKAFSGTYKGGATIKGINDYARNMANQNYGQVFERQGQAYDRNRGNAFGNWSANRNNAAENYMTNYGVSRDVFDRNYNATKDEFAPRARGAELEYARDWDQYAYEGDNSYRRWKALVDANSV